MNTLEKNIKQVGHFIYIINKYEFRHGKFDEGLFLDNYVGTETRFFKRNTDTILSDKIKRLYVDIHELKGYCIDYIKIHQLKEDQFNNLLTELLLDLYSINSYGYEQMYSFIGKMVDSFKKIDQGMFKPWFSNLSIINNHYQISGGYYGKTRFKC